MCCNIDKYIFDEDDPFAKDNREFLRKTMYLLYFLLFLYLLLFYYINRYVL